MSKFYRYLFKKQSSMLLIVGSILVSYQTLTYLNTDFIAEYNEGILTAINNPLGNFAGILIFLSFIIPIYEFHFKHQKLNINLAYSMPIKKQSLYLARYLMGLTLLVIFSTLSFLVPIVFLAFKDNLFNLIYFLPAYFALEVFAIFIYSIFSFIYTRASNNVDGILMMIAYIFIGVFIASIYMKFFKPDFLNSFQFILFYPIFILEEWFGDLTQFSKPIVDVGEIISLIIYGIIGIVSFFLFTFLNPLDKAEDVGGISRSGFLYKLIIPLGTFAMMLDNYFFLSIVMILIVAYFANVIYLRSFKRFDYLYLVTLGSALIAFIISIIMH